MPSLTCFNRRFTPNWQMTILAILAMALLLRLGLWQLERAVEKKTLLVTSKQQSVKKPIKWQAGSAAPLQFEALEVKGQYLPNIFFLDNQHVNHEFAFSVLSPLEIEKDKVILIDRGFVKADITRQQIPDIKTPEEPLTLEGTAYYPSEKGLVLGENYEKKAENIFIIEKIDTKLVGQFLHKSVYPFIIRLSKKERAGFIREWAVVSMPPERHYAYALQWFAMALVILILFIGLNLKKIS